MSLSTVDLVKARDTIAGLLEELALEAYLFEVEPRDSQWEVKIECAIKEGWETVLLPISRERLLAISEAADVREQVLRDWRGKLAACIKVQDS
jgi:hypothetical protein